MEEGGGTDGGNRNQGPMDGGHIDGGQTNGGRINRGETEVLTEEEEGEEFLDGEEVELLTDGDPGLRDPGLRVVRDVEMSGEYERHMTGVTHDAQESSPQPSCAPKKLLPSSSTRILFSGIARLN